MSARKKGKPAKSRVSFAEVDQQPTHFDKIKKELERLKRRDEEQERRYAVNKKHEIELMKAQLDKERLGKGIQILPGITECKQKILKSLAKEEVYYLQEERMKMAAETARMKNEISMKHGTHVKKNAPDLIELAKEFVQPNKSSNVLGLPENIIRELTLEEIMDLKKIFDMYDVAGNGYITRKNTQRLTNLLGFNMTRDNFKKTMDKIVQDPAGKITFVSFLEFVVKSQEGNDPFDEVMQCFRILDREDKGYLTSEDIRVAAHECDCQLSNKHIRQMMDEADTSGDGKVNVDEFLIIMLRTAAFNRL